MSGWNYRVVRRKDAVETTYAIHEAYYDDEDRVWGITENPVGVASDTLDGLPKVFDIMKEALKLPVLDYDSIPEEGAISPGEKRIKEGDN